MGQMLVLLVQPWQVNNMDREIERKWNLSKISLKDLKKLIRNKNVLI